MPIKKENRHKYPKDWKESRKAHLEKCKYHCELCYAPHGELIQRNKESPALWWSWCMADLARWSKGIKVVLTRAHINQDPTDNRPCNVLMLCQRCHNKIDAPYRSKNREKK